MKARVDRLMTAWGDVFFRWRSYLPLLLVPLVVLAVVHSRTSLGPTADRLWEIVSLGIAMLGLALRVITVGFAAPGTSGRNTREQKARSLNTTGVYSIVRHPLYLANTVIALGLALFPHAWLAPVAVLLLSLGYYACIARREEVFLKQRFGAAFEVWAARVPAVVPAPWHWVPPDRRFDWHTVLRREFYALALILVVPVLLDAAEDALTGRAVAVDAVWGVVAVVGAVLFVVFRTLKKRGNRERMRQPRQSLTGR